jgi:hypothetical protein
MLKSVIGEGLWAELSEGEKVVAVLRGQATLKQLSEGLLDGSEQLRDACREFLAETDTSFENLPVGLEPHDASESTTNASLAANTVAHTTVNSGHPDELVQLRITKRSARPVAQHLKPRFGLPDGFEPRRQRYGRSVLLELNIYRLPNGQEFLPVHPSGPLGTRRHLYALVTAEQYLAGKRGSVYLRNDGRIFDYSVDTENPSGDLFDTGYTIYDLERTGRYAPEPRRKRIKPAKRGESIKPGVERSGTPGSTQVRSRARAVGDSGRK